jgi:hypothetical protein
MSLRRRRPARSPTESSQPRQPFPKLRSAPRVPNQSPSRRWKPPLLRLRRRMSRCGGPHRCVRRCRAEQRPSIRLCAAVQCPRGLCPRLVQDKSFRVPGSRCLWRLLQRPCLPPRSHYLLRRFHGPLQRLRPLPHQRLRLLGRLYVHSRVRLWLDNPRRVPWCLRVPIWWRVSSNSSSVPCRGRQPPPRVPVCPRAARLPYPANRFIAGPSGPASR